MRASRLLVHLDKIEIDNAADLDGKKRITGRVFFQKPEESSGQLYLRISFLAAKVRFADEYPLARAMPTGDQAVHFSFPPINESRIAHAGPLPVFLELCARTDSDPSGPLTIVSNCVATLVNVTVAENSNK